MVRKKQFIALVIAAYAYKKYKCRKPRRRWWVNPVNQKRKCEGYFETTYQMLKQDNPEAFHKTFRMDVTTFNSLLEILKDRLTKSSIRTPISPECRLVITLLYLAHGGFRSTYCDNFRIAESSFRRIVKETSEAIWEELNCEYLSQPNYKEWCQIAEEFRLRWYLPNCLGAIDAKHINMKPPLNSQFYKDINSIVLVAACDANYCFTMVDIGAYGSDNDGGILKETSFGRKLFDGTLNIPKASKLPRTGDVMPYFFVVDATFQLHENLMRPYTDRSLSKESDNFNKRISHARVTIENAFGIMSSRWRALLSEIQAAPHVVEAYVKAITVLHNYLMLHCQEYCPIGYADQVVDGHTVLGQWRDTVPYLQGLQPTRAHNASKIAYGAREKLKNYFNLNT